MAARRAFGESGEGGLRTPFLAICRAFDLPSVQNTAHGEAVMTGVEAILVVRNGAKTLARVLDHLETEGVSLLAADHGSTDATWDLLAARRGGVVRCLRREPYKGMHDQERQLSLKAEMMESVRAPWVLHLDADEIIEAPEDGQTLGNLAAEADRAGAAAVDFREFVFVPTTEDEDYAGGDFVQTMRWYYHFAPPGRALQRLFRREAKLDKWLASGGHRVCDDANLHAVRGRHRHYIGLSLDDLRSQYLPRVFPGAELARGWHANRVPTSPDFVTAPDRSRMYHLDRDGWRFDRPERQHLIYHQQPPFERPAPRSVGAAPERSAKPFIVGTGRSGTTLLRMLLDAHPDMAITPETHWLPPLLDVMRRGSADRRDVTRALADSHNWQDMNLPDETLASLLDRHWRADADGGFGEAASRLLAGIYDAYADAHGAARAGDKTPLHGLRMQQIHEVLPEAAFIHVVRDGRDVATSYRGLWFGPGHDPRAAAMHWAWRVGRIRQQAEFVPRYMEVRYEELVTDTEAVLRRICAFCELTFAPEQLRAHERAAGRLAELGDLVTPAGVRTEAQRRGIHKLTERPPDPSRIGRWRTAMSREEVSAFEAVAGPLLEALGYDSAR